MKPFLGIKQLLGYAYLLLTSCLIVANPQKTAAQISIITPYPAAAGNLTRGGIDTTLLTVQATFGAACTGVTATITLPSGVIYVPGSVVKTGGLTGAAIAYSGGTASAPQFSITGISSAGDISFRILRTADCGVTGAGKDVVSITGSCGSVTESDVNTNAYTIYAPSLSIAAPASITTANVGNTYARTTSVTNGGNGCLDTVFYYVVMPTGKLRMADSPTHTINVNLLGGALPAQAFTPVRTSGDTLFYKIWEPNAFGADNKWCNGEVLNIVENVVVNACGSWTTYYGARWGRNNAYCQTVTGSSVMTTTNTGATFTVKVASTPTVSGCLPNSFVVQDSIINSGSVGVYYNKFTITNSTAASNGYIDTASIMISTPGVAAYHPANGFTVNSTNTNTLACILGKPQNITYSFPAEFVLAVGGKVAVAYTMITGCRDTSTCTAAYTPSATTVTHYYHLFCDPTITNKASSSITLGYAMKVNAYTIQLPAVVGSGATFTVKVPVSFTMPTTPASVLTRRLGIASLTLPTGVSLVSASEALDTGAVASASMVGNVASYRFTPNYTTKSHYVIFRLRNDSACGYQPIVAQAKIILDSSCTSGQSMFATACYTATTKYTCPGGAGCTGISGPSLSAKRYNYGQPDNDGDGRPDAVGTLDMNKVDPDRFMIGDTLRSISTGTIIPRGAAPLDTFAYVYGEWHFPMGNWQPAGTATVAVTRGGVTNTYSNVSISTITSGSKYRADWKANFRTYQSGDSVSVTALFRLSDVNYTTGTPVNEVGAKNGSSTYDFSKDALCRVIHILYASNTATPPTGGNITGTGATAGYTCDSSLYNCYLTGWKHLVATNAATANGCTAVTKNFTSSTYTNNATSGGQYFLAEYRPVAVPDTFIVTMPLGWDYVGPVASTMVNTTKRGGTATQTYTITPIVSTNGYGATQLLFDYYTAFQNGIVPFAGTEGVVYTTNYSVRPSGCTTPDNSRDTVVEFGHLANPFGTTLSRYTITGTAANTMKYGTRPALTLTNTTGTISANTPNNYWDVQVATNTQASSNVWFALEKGSGTVTVDSVAYLNSGGTATTGLISAAAAPAPFTAAGNKWYQTNASIAASGNQKLRVYFHYSNCGADSLMAYAGFDCNGYPASPQSPTCSTTVTAVQYLKVLSKASEIQLSVSRQPGNGSSVSMCSTDSTTFIVNSAQPANIVSPRVQVIVPSGMSVITPFPVEYPLGSGTWQNITPTVIDGGYELDLSNHTGIGTQGLKGTALNPAAAGRQAKVKVAFNTGCGYRSGSNVSLYGYANTTCGTAAIGDGTNVKSLPLNITGIPTGGGSINMSLSLPTTTIACGGTATISFVSIPLGGPTQSADSVIYTLPSGIEYGGNFTPDSNCTGCMVTTAPGLTAGTTDVKVKIPDALPANTRIKYSFDVTGAGGGCGSSNIDVTAVRTYPGVFCGATQCTASTRVVGSSASATITRVKPALVATNLSLTSGTYLPGQTVGMKFDYQNNGNQAASAGIYQAEFFRSGDANTPFATRTMSKAVAINAAASDTFSVTIPSIAAQGEIITSKLRTKTAASASQCICASSQASISMPLPARLISFGATLQGEALVQVQWRLASEIGLSSYAIERSEDGTVFAPIGIVTAGNKQDARYTYDDAALPLYARVLYYRLRMNDAGGAVNYSPVAAVRLQQLAGDISVIPNPASSSVSVIWLSGGGQTRLQVFNALGQPLLSQTVVAAKGANTFQLGSVSEWPAGNYILQLSDDGGRLMRSRFAVAH